MATLTTQTISRAGHLPTYAACAVSGDKCKPTDRTFLHVKNGDASAHAVHVITPDTVEGLAIADLQVSVPATSERMIGPISPSLFRSSVDGLAEITYPGGVTSLTIAVLQL